MKTYNCDRCHRQIGDTSRPGFVLKVLALNPTDHPPHGAEMCLSCLMDALDFAHGREDEPAHQPRRHRAGQPIAN